MLDIINEKNPNLLIAHTGQKTNFFSIILNPSSQDENHFYLTANDGNEWLHKQWQHLEDNYHPVYFDEFNYPIYFEKRKTT